jgi:hypothetical protein
MQQNYRYIKGQNQQYYTPHPQQIPHHHHHHQIVGMQNQFINNSSTSLSPTLTVPYNNKNKYNKDGTLSPKNKFQQQQNTNSYTNSQVPVSYYQNTMIDSPLPQTNNNDSLLQMSQPSIATTASSSTTQTVPQTGNDRNTQRPNNNNNNSNKNRYNFTRTNNYNNYSNNNNQRPYYNNNNSNYHQKYQNTDQNSMTRSKNPIMVNALQIAYASEYKPRTNNNNNKPDFNGDFNLDEAAMHAAKQWNNLKD